MLSDAAVTDVLNLIGDIFPIPNRCPSLYKYKGNLSGSQDLPIEIHPCSEGEIFVLPFGEQIERILNKYSYAHTLSAVRNVNEFSDVSSGQLFPQVKPDTLYLTLMDCHL